MAPEKARDPQELRDVPAVAVCAQCGDPDCPGHDFERSGERPIHRLLAWEDGETPPMRSLWRTAMATASDLELWVRASRSTGNGVGPAFTFALGCEVAAVACTTIPMAAIVGAAAWLFFHDKAIVLSVLATFGRIALVFVPTMIVIHLVHQAVIARVGGKLGEPISRSATARAGLYACGWDLATGPAGILAPLLALDVTAARARMAGNSTLYRDATRIWLRDVHGVEGEADIKRAQRATLPYMVVLLLLACAGVGWSILSAFV
jgi:hypothetical protein